MKQKILFLLCLCAYTSVMAQVTTTPLLPTENSPLTLTFDISRCSTQKGSLVGYAGPIYAHMGVMTTENKKPTDWIARIALWPDKTTADKCNIPEVTLTPIGNGIYELKMEEGVRTFFSKYQQDEPTYIFAEDERITRLEIVLRNADGTKDGRCNGNSSKNIFVDFHEEGLKVAFTEPTSTFVERGRNVTFKASATEVCDLTLKVNGEVIQTTRQTTDITADHTFATGGNYTVEVIAQKGEQSLSQTLNLCVRGEVVPQPKPGKVRYGINYIDDRTVTLVLYAPRKEFIYVVGDFNDWELNNDYMMKKDGDDWWLTLSGLEKGEEYAFLYNVDGKFTVGDPYANKVLDKGNDKTILSSVYPNLKVLSDKAVGSNMVSVLQTARPAYPWEVKDFKGADPDKLMIYEMLIRDFTGDGNGLGTMKLATEKLDYLKALGINAIELMPFTEFDGNSSWGYNPAFYFAPDKAYGTEEDYKRFIDECHKRGIAVIQDMVLNHSYGQSPFCRLYATPDGSTGAKPSADNPWYNVTSPNTSYSWGADFNHESVHTQALVDSICSFWMDEYKIDGFRFDFTKGFTNTPGDGSGYDASRIAILKRMDTEIKKRNPDAYVILEHFCDGKEEKELGDAGLMVWNRVNDPFYQSGMAVQTKSSFANVLARQTFGWKYDHKVSYMESHDEERTAYKVRNFSNLQNSKATLGRQMDQLALNAAFFLLLPGPKMLYQFGELGYDYSINSKRGTDEVNASGKYRTDPKELRWDYSSVPERAALYQKYAALLNFRNLYSGAIADGNLITEIGEENWPVRKIILNHSDVSFVVLGNFHATSAAIVVPGFPSGGVWYDLFTGEETDMTGKQTAPISMQPGEQRVYVNKKVLSGVGTVKEDGEIRIYTDPASGLLHAEGQDLKTLSVYDRKGCLILSAPAVSSKGVDVSKFATGFYIAKVVNAKGNAMSQVIFIK